MGVLVAVPRLDEEAPMTVDEFLGLRQWMIDRWPGCSSLTNSQWAAYRDELERFDATDVWAAAYLCFQAAPEFAPGVAKLVRLATEQTLQHSQRKALPAPEGVCWAEYSRSRWGRVIPMFEVAKSIAEGSDIV